MAMWRSGRRFFTLAAILMILTAAAHTAGNLASHEPDAAEQRVFAAMNNFHESLGLGMTFSMQDIFWCLVFTMSITFTALGIINLLLAANPQTPDRLLRAVGWVNAIWVGAFLVLTWKYQIPPPLISALVIEVCVLAGLLLPGGAGKALGAGAAGG